MSANDPSERFTEHPGAGELAGHTRRANVAEQVAERIIELIERQGLRPGDEIPAESAMAGQFGVNRLAVREAIRILVSREILISSQGRPARVTVPSARVFGQLLRFRLQQQSLHFDDLVDARRAIEGVLTRRAAQRVASGLATVHRAELLLAEMADAITDQDRFIRLDLAFHRELAELAGNGMLQLVLDSLGSVLLDARRSSYTGRLRRGEKLADTVAAHRAVLDAIRTGNPDAAAEVMDTHLLDTAKDLHAAESDRS